MSESTRETRNLPKAKVRFFERFPKYYGHFVMASFDLSPISKTIRNIYQQIAHSELTKASDFFRCLVVSYFLLYDKSPSQRGGWEGDL